MGVIGGIIIYLIIKSYLNKEETKKQREHIAKLKREGGLSF